MPLADVTAISFANPLFLLVTGICAAAAQSCYIRSFAAADASLVAPFEYTKLIFAGIIVASPLYIARHEAALGKREPPAPSKVDPPPTLPRA